ncbi:MAG: hypothetical protein K8R87_04605 [Verrucomicrobia bacterium]|nr:hypothetical protein [Verrucomicrobiota bacterium]
MTGWKPALTVLSLAAFVAAQDLPLPSSVPPPGTGTGMVKPTISIKPPASKPVAQPKLETAAEQALAAMEQALIEKQKHEQIAAAAKRGDTAALKQLIVMAGPVDDAVLKSPKPPAVPDGRVALIGMDGAAEVGKSLDQFFGAPLTPEREKQLFDAVKSQLAGGNQSAVEVKVVAWWPTEGVMAVTLAPRS